MFLFLCVMTFVCGITTPHAANKHMAVFSTFGHYTYLPLLWDELTHFPSLYMIYGYGSYVTCHQSIWHHS